MESKQYGATHVLKVTVNEQLGVKILEYVNKHQINFATVSAIGCLTDCIIGIYNTKLGIYDWEKYSGNNELISFNGSIAFLEGKRALHAHLSISDENRNIYGGHFQDGKVCAVAEVFINVISDDVINRVVQDESNLPIWKLNKE